MYIHIHSYEWQELYCHATIRLYDVMKQLLTLKYHTYQWGKILCTVSRVPALPIHELQSCQHHVYVYQYCRH
jgi:hypothetical protein